MSIILNAEQLTKFVVIASACRSTRSVASNMTHTAQAFGEVMGLGVMTPELATGYYAEAGQKGSHAQSIIIATDRTYTVTLLSRLFREKYQQDCVLIWNRETGDVTLDFGKEFQQIGSNGMSMLYANVGYALMEDIKLPDTYTIAADGSVWEVK